MDQLVSAFYPQKCSFFVVFLTCTMRSSESRRDSPYRSKQLLNHRANCREFEALSADSSCLSFEEDASERDMDHRYRYKVSKSMVWTTNTIDSIYPQSYFRQIKR
jgi:hypothetical protein